VRGLAGVRREPLGMCPIAYVPLVWHSESSILNS
jgi:hypothetical protein